MRFCVLCFRLGRRDFCEVCEAGFVAVQLGDAQRFCKLPSTEALVLSSYAYRGLCRESILACKSQGFRRLGPALVRRSLACPFLQESLARCDVIMPAPSSLWSRWRGSLDLAIMLAHGLGQAAGLSVRSPPRSLSFRWHKQALRDSSQRRGVFRSHQKIYDASYFEPYSPTALRGARMRVLVVDDVVTSGNTLSALAACFTEVDFEFYTLASAFRPGKDQAC
jgi:predicted amidophosphoribosyltransferase